MYVQESSYNYQYAKCPAYVWHQLTALYNILQPVYGVKGSCVLHRIPGFDTIVCCPVDYMHCVLLGVVRRLMSLWFKSNNHGSDWYDV